MHREGVAEASVDTSVDFCGIRLTTPVVPASGTLSREAVEEARGVYGAILPKTTTPGPRNGNPTPRIAETAAGMVNSIGLQNPGVERFMEGLDDFDLGVPVFVSVAADTAEEFREVCETVSSDGRVSAVELNLSCPNVEHGGLTFCASPDSVTEVVEMCRDVSGDKSLFVKLTFEGVVPNALAAERAGASAITAINTIPALTIDARNARTLVRGGLSGPAIKPVALRAVYDVARAVEIPVMASGGVSCGTDVAEFMLAGATAVQVGTSSFVREPSDILSEFVRYLEENATSATRLIGNLS